MVWNRFSDIVRPIGLLVMLMFSVPLVLIWVVLLRLCSIGC